MSCSEETKVIRLYSGPAPGSENWRREESENNSNFWQTRVIYNVIDPTLTVFAGRGRATGTGVVICPGGAFHALSIDSEGFDAARWLSERGISCFVLKYRLVQCSTSDPVAELMAKAARPPVFETDCRSVVPLGKADALAAIGYVRERAAEFGVRSDRIGLLGFSAGGTVAASAALDYTPQTRPDFVAPIYLQYDWTLKAPVPKDAPPLFVLAASDDQIGLAPHSVALYQDWVQAGKSAELHLYSKGGHGFGMRQQNLPSDAWIRLFVEWLEAEKLAGVP